MTGRGDRRSNVVCHIDPDEHVVPVETTRRSGSLLSESKALAPLPARRSGPAAHGRGDAPRSQGRAAHIPGEARGGPMADRNHARRFRGPGPLVQPGRRPERATAFLRTADARTGGSARRSLLRARDRARRASAPLDRTLRRRAQGPQRRFGARASLTPPSRPPLVPRPPRPARSRRLQGRLPSPRR